MADFRKRVDRLERRLLGTSAALVRQRAAAERLTVRWFIVDRLLAREHGEDAHRVPADGEAAWRNFLRWRQEAPPRRTRPGPSWTGTRSCACSTRCGRTASSMAGNSIRSVERHE